MADDLKRRNPVRPNKRLGQHFLTDKNIARLILKKAGIQSQDTVIEIGPGTGVLTEPIALESRDVIAVEKDSRMVQALSNRLEKLSINNVSIIEKDILRFDFYEHRERCGKPLIVMGNIPYNISSQILIRLIEQRSAISFAVLMFQKELADRIMSQPGTRSYGRISVRTQYCARVESILSVKASSFYPVPKVDSKVLRITFQERPFYEASDESLFCRVIADAFNKRRKTIKNALQGGGLGIEPDQLLTIFEKTGVDPGQRAETISVEKFVAMSNLLHRMPDRIEVTL
ncbi:MAG: 16S rRNA (adenine(1518)-N(6)/adenine(1519)-N(6))-dimethyltransferase RsmA [Pseudomonadota bacterium]